MSKYSRVLFLTALALVAPALTWAQAVTVEYYHLDAVGSVRAVTDHNGAVVRTHPSPPFGTGDGVTPGTDPLRYTGKERDAETGLDYFGARYYGSRIGRFTGIDPVLDQPESLLNPQRWNRYTYALNNPVKFTDPDGRNPVLAAAVVVWGIYEVVSTAYDAYSTYKTLSDPNASADEKRVTTGLFLAGALPGVPGGGATAGRTLIRHADEISEATIAIRRTEGAGRIGRFADDVPTGATKNWSALFKSEGEARALARTKLGANAVEVSPGKWRSRDGKWQYRAKPGDVADRHIHLEELDPITGEVIQNVHLRWAAGTGR